MEKEEITMAGQTDTLSFETKNVEEISAHFSTDLKNGLSSEEAKKYHLIDDILISKSSKEKSLTPPILNA